MLEELIQQGDVAVETSALNTLRDRLDEVEKVAEASMVQGATTVRATTGVGAASQAGAARAGGAMQDSLLGTHARPAGGGYVGGGMFGGGGILGGSPPPATRVRGNATAKDSPSVGSVARAQTADIDSEVDAKIGISRSSKTSGAIRREPDEPAQAPLKPVRASLMALERSAKGSGESGSKMLRGKSGSDLLSMAWASKPENPAANVLPSMRRAEMQASRNSGRSPASPPTGGGGAEARVMLEASAKHGSIDELLGVNRKASLGREAAEVAFMVAAGRTWPPKKDGPPNEGHAVETANMSETEAEEAAAMREVEEMERAVSGEAGGRRSMAERRLASATSADPASLDLAHLSSLIHEAEVTGVPVAVTAGARQLLTDRLVAQREVDPTLSPPKPRLHPALAAVVGADYNEQTRGKGGR